MPLTRPPGEADEAFAEFRLTAVRQQPDQEVVPSGPLDDEPVCARRRFLFHAHLHYPLASMRASASRLARSRPMVAIASVLPPRRYAIEQSNAWSDPSIEISSHRSACPT